MQERTGHFGRLFLPSSPDPRLSLFSDVTVILAEKKAGAKLDTFSLF